MRFTLIAAGTFTMGSRDPLQELQRRYGTVYRDFTDEFPPHAVTISRAYYLGTCEVTQAEFERVMGVNPSYFARTGRGADKVRGLDTSRLPVESVSWHRAMDFCSRLSELSEERKLGRVYRLPTEAEWEFACRAGSTSAYSFGDGRDLPDFAWNAEGSAGCTHEVGRLKPNDWGLHDMHGNVWEWCHDWYGRRFYERSAETNPIGPVVADGRRRVTRGGSWMHSETLGLCRSSARGHEPPDSENSNIGFRVVLEAPSRP
jgi:formylglycine-generating enzyme required for sulfatase activity